ncbi:MULTISPECIES: LPXTG cell wall anchor domain-containing protein [unclassified Enterococcus]|uniref:LPXTG cell wall anchor domain-containing protein n=1 Tax=unclassified Enterococcus TaxID=2608891 RepID=UPI001CE12055|nr:MULTISPECIES: LPXTG cell wall anchor domain-containing protein [unclassified Enterococcus]MCA5013865.1 LPXTG cell wall anchor domain-containing protein [Enterococcus sp. S23]MCA5017361.1 LPXTG cell wall anchor domain-containing protein [Enterococcus sp. S22(2020)]
MKKRIKYMIISFAFVLTLAVVYPLNAAANANGGELKTDGVISFYEDSSSTEPTSTTPPSSTTEPSSVPEPSTSEPKVVKPVGRYPSTGEMVKTSLVFTGAALIVIGLLLFLWKRKKDNEGRDNQ